MLDFNRFEWLTFDCYGTLIDWEAGLLPVLRRFLENHSQHLEDAEILEFYGHFEQVAESGEYRSYSDVLRCVMQSFGVELKFVPAEDELNFLVRSLPCWNPWPDTVAALRFLKSRFQLAILSNIDDDLFASTRPHLEIEFDHVITAQQARAYKPSHRIFELAFQRIGTPRDRILHVGQSVFHDVVPAQALGLAAVRVNRPSARAGVGAVKKAVAKPDLEVPDLATLAQYARQNSDSRTRG